MRVAESLTDALADIPDGARVFIGSATGVPRALVAALDAGGRGHGGQLVAGYLVADSPISRSDLSVVSLQPSGSLWRSAHSAGVAAVRYSDYETIFQPGRPLALDAALVQVSRPGPDGRYSLGTSVGGARAAVDAASLVIAQINRYMPYTFGQGELEPSQVDVAVRVDEPLPDLVSRDATASDEAIARAVAAMITDGSCAQMGVGVIPQLVGRHLSGRPVDVRSGMISDWVRDLVGPGHSVVAAEALGSAKFYSWLDRNPGVTMARAAATHGAGSPERPFFAVNSALEIDTAGRVNAERSGTRILSGPGGMPDFATIALASPGGANVVMLPATSGRGQRSNVVADVRRSGEVTLPAWLADTFVTELGVARVRGVPESDRVRIVASIAAPAFRSGLGAS